MTEQTPSAGSAPGLPHDALERLALFAEWTGTEPPEQLLDAEGAPSDNLLTYAEASGLSLDWLMLADEKGLVLQLHRAVTAAKERSDWRKDLSSAAHHALMLHGLTQALCSVDDGTKEGQNMVCALSRVVMEKAHALATALERTADEYGS